MRRLALLLVLGLAACSHAPRKVFVNFDGGFIFSGVADDARQNVSALAPGTIAFPKYSTGGVFINSETVKNLTIEALNRLFKDYNVLFVLERPEDATYDMVMIGGSSKILELPPEVVGVSTKDCKDRNKNNIIFVFSDSLTDDLSLFPQMLFRVMYTVVAHEFAHSVGLMHTTDTSDIMFPSLLLPVPTEFGHGTLAGSNSCDMDDNYQDSKEALARALGYR